MKEKVSETFVLIFPSPPPPPPGVEKRKYHSSAVLLSTGWMLQNKTLLESWLGEKVWQLVHRGQSGTNGRGHQSGGLFPGARFSPTRHTVGRLAAGVWPVGGRRVGLGHATGGHLRENGPGNVEDLHGDASEAVWESLVGRSAAFYEQRTRRGGGVSAVDDDSAADSDQVAGAIFAAVFPSGPGARLFLFVQSVEVAVCVQYAVCHLARE